MRALIEGRLAALRAEYEAGEEARATLEARQAELRDTMLRITGGILVLEGVLRELDTRRDTEDQVAGLWQPDDNGFERPDGDLSDHQTIARAASER